MIEVSLRIRPAAPQDQQQIANLMFFESHVHRHLDWRAPLDWLGSHFYWVVENNARVLAALACPINPANIAWVRLFTHSNKLTAEDAWTALWQVAKMEIEQQGGATVALIAMHQWLNDLLVKNSFNHAQDILMLEWKSSKIPDRIKPNGLVVRNMQKNDLPKVAELDASAFLPLWQNPLDALEKALPQAASATVVENGQGLVGYQISTPNPFGAHLARLAVSPDAHRLGIGSLIVNDLIRRLKRKGVSRLTVNTQSDNYASIALYEKMGFFMTGEKFPVYCYSIPGSH
ncbi:MAG: GNAT family N-acetyltransferase [Anaerolineae bacterium]|nr:GNAT family N-acetyltransferase [Anaerolineae bacterium]MDK1080610.1 GNAT family N-acetyltransferase [Anaerolineae bacterium]MDK1117596.1 GNAT family N-acetyltransferase [Anaerolineae bacterium]